MIRRPLGVVRRPGVLLGCAAALAFVLVWHRVITGSRDLVGGDILYLFPPWSHTPTAHPPHNSLIGDTVLQFLGWEREVRHALVHGRLPLWNADAFGGGPLLANDQSAAFSPYTWVALPFTPGRGMSLAMLLKLWVAGTGTALFVRALGGRGLAAVAGGIVFACSSAMIDWLGWPHTAVASLIPWVFASVEWWIRTQRRVALLAMAVAVGLQFLAGQAELSMQFAYALTLYALIRIAVPRARAAVDAVALAGAGLLGAGLAAVQLLPFADELRESTLGATRAAQGQSSGYLDWHRMSSWLIPNAHGNPGFEPTLGPFPDYNEAVGFVGIGALVLAIAGTVWLWRTHRRGAVALVATGLFAAGIAYGPLVPFSRRAPGLATGYNIRYLFVICLVLAALSGLGVEAVLSCRPLWGRRVSRVAGTLAAAALATLLVLAGMLFHLRGRVDRIMPGIHGRYGFWVVVAGVSLVAAAALALTAASGGRRLAAAGFGALALLESGMFAIPYNPITDPADVPPASATMAWLRGAAGGGSIAALDEALPTEAAMLYDVRDVRGYDPVVGSTRYDGFWSHADPGYTNTGSVMLSRPDPRWLAAAGVALVVVDGDAALAGTVDVRRVDGVAVGRVPGARPFAFIAPRVTTAATTAQALGVLDADPLGRIVVERPCCLAAQAAPRPASETLRTLTREPEHVVLDAGLARAGTVVVLQSEAPGWEATVDGNPVSIDPADVAFQSVQVGAGRHRVELRYAPVSMRLGVLVTAVSALVVMVAGVALVWARRRALRSSASPQA